MLCFSMSQSGQGTGRPPHPFSLCRLNGWGGLPVNAQTIRHTLHPIGLHGCGPRRKPLLKMMHNAEDQQTVDMDYWNHVLWFDETKSNFFGQDRDKWVLPTVKHGGWSVMVWGCMSSAGTGELQITEESMNANMYCDILKQSMLPSPQKLGPGQQSNKVTTPNTPPRPPLPC